MKRVQENDEFVKRRRVSQILKRSLNIDEPLKRPRIGNWKDHKTIFMEGVEAGRYDAMKHISEKIDTAVENVVAFYESEIRQYDSLRDVPKWIF
tara:strand:+ start:3694 stop:3975 length:282 start_codon:yes stop_codon:yes gene_type:complete